MSNTGAVVWIIGRPASGKSTLARSLATLLREQGHPNLWLDSDDMREVMTPHPTYTDEEREVFYSTVAHVARRCYQGGVVAIISATASRRAYRERLRAAVPRFIEIYVACSLKEVQRRDPSGLYGKAARGEITGLPGFDKPFEEPENAELELDSEAMEPEEMVSLSLERMNELLNLSLSA